jgi:hypothetical protein
LSDFAREAGILREPTSSPDSGSNMIRLEDYRRAR